MKFLAVHPSCLMYSNIFLRLEPLGLELVAAAARQAGHEVRIIDLQIEKRADYLRMIDEWQPDAVGWSCNYLANVPEILDLAQETRTKLPKALLFVGGHSASFVAEDLLRQSNGALDCVLKGEGEVAVVNLLSAARDDRASLHKAAGVVTQDGEGPPATFVKSLDDLSPARDLLRHRRKYFIGELDPCASMEFSRGCPWDCVFCSAWTFYGRSYRVKSPEAAAEELAAIKEPGIFLLDDVAFIQAEHGMKIGELIAKKGVKKHYYMETRGDVLLRNKDVFLLWKKLGLKYMFLGLEAIDAEGLKQFRKRVTLTQNFEALEFARSTGITVAINLIADPSWDKERFKVIRDWCMEIPEVVNISVNTPYPGTEIWHTEARKLTSRDYRLFDIQHAVLPTAMPLDEFYKELVMTQRVLATKHLGWKAVRSAGGVAARQLVRGQTNFAKMIWKFDSVYNPKLQIADHQRPVKYEISLPPEHQAIIDPNLLYVHPAKGRRGREIGDREEAFVNETRMGVAD